MLEDLPNLKFMNSKEGKKHIKECKECQSLLLGLIQYVKDILRDDPVITKNVALIVNHVFPTSTKEEES